MSFVPDPSWPTIVDLGRELWGEPTLTKPDEIRFGKKQGQKIVPSKSLFYDFDSGAKGGYIRLWNMARNNAPLPPRTDGLGKTGNGKVTGIPPWQDIRKTYDYPGTDADPRLIQVVRTRSGKPRFRQRQPLGNGRWKWNVQDIPDHDRRLYRLAELRDAPKGETVFICAGERDTDRLHNAGLTAVTNIGGEGKWRGDYASEFRDRPCVVLQDNDEAGARHVPDVARSLRGVAASVKVLLLPDLPTKGDVSDFLDAGNTLDELLRLADAAPEWRPSDDTGPAGDDLDDHELPQIVWRDICAADWAERPVPDLQFIIEEWIPRRQVTGLYGVGGINKTDFLIHLLMAKSAGLVFIGYDLGPAEPVYGLFCEDTEAEIIRRAARIAAGYRRSLAEFPDFRFASLVGFDVTEFVSFDAGGAMKVEYALLRFDRAIMRHGIRLAALDTIPDFFGGNEIARREVSSFMRKLDAISITRDCAIVFSAHPSVRGRDRGTMDSGSTGWEGKVRSRLSLRDPGEEDEDDGPPDKRRHGPPKPTDRRVLTRHKSNYAAPGATLELIWRDGFFSTAALDAEAAKARQRGPPRNAACDGRFLELLAKAGSEGRHVSDSRNAHGRYAPDVFARMPGGKGFSEAEYTRAMARLFDAGRIRVVEVKRSARLVATQP